MWDHVKRNWKKYLSGVIIFLFGNIIFPSLIMEPTSIQLRKFIVAKLPEGSLKEILKIDKENKESDNNLIFCDNLSFQWRAEDSLDKDALNNKQLKLLEGYKGGLIHFIKLLSSRFHLIMELTPYSTIGINTTISILSADGKNGFDLVIGNGDYFTIKSKYLGTDGFVYDAIESKNHGALKNQAAIGKPLWIEIDAIPSNGDYLIVAKIEYSPSSVKNPDLSKDSFRYEFSVVKEMNKERQKWLLRVGILNPNLSTSTVVSTIADCKIDLGEEFY